MTRIAGFAHAAPVPYTDRMTVSIDLDKLRGTPVAQDPFDHLVVPGFVSGAAFDAVERDYPKIDRPGSLPLTGLDYGPAFRDFVDAIQGPEMTALMEEKFGIALQGRPTMVTVRARCRPKDGQIHTDSKGKLITVLIYMNGDWDSEGGRLRLLRKPDDLEDYAVEVPPERGTMIAFRNGETAWHGHRSFDGPRRAIQLNWVVDDSYLKREQRRHGLSAFLKKFKLAS